MPDNNPNNENKYYRLPEYTNEGLGRDLGGDRKRPNSFEGKESGADYNLSPTKNESKKLELERRLAENGSLSAEHLSADRKKTLHDPRKFEDLMKDRYSQSATQQPVTQKLSGNEIDSLKLSTLKSDSHEVRAKQKVDSFFQNVASIFGGIFSPNTRKLMCSNYGHIAPANWTGEYPKCTECGKEIRSQNELRKASATHKYADMKPHDNRLDL